MPVVCSGQLVIVRPVNTRRSIIIIWLRGWPLESDKNLSGEEGAIRKSTTQDILITAIWPNRATPDAVFLIVVSTMV
jgi:hypothetical protein